MISIAYGQNELLLFSPKPDTELTNDFNIQFFFFKTNPKRSAYRHFNLDICFVSHS